MSPVRRDQEGRLEAGPTWERLADRQIREAQERGEFDDLPIWFDGAAAIDAEGIGS